MLNFLPRIVVAGVVAAAVLFGSGSLCLPSSGDGEERKKCEDVCAAVGSCADVGLTSEEDCLVDLCDDQGFREVKDAADVVVVDLAELPSHDCILAADTCADIVVCTCDDACARVDDCTGDDGGGCAADCGALVEQDPAAMYAENLCIRESACEDLPLCSQ